MWIVLPEAAAGLAESPIINGQHEDAMHVKTTNGTPVKFPYTVDELRLDNPGTSFPDNVSSETLSEFGAFEVTIAPSPACDAMTQTCVYDDLPHLVSEQWVLGCNVINKSEADASSAVRSERNRLLAECDWIVLSSIEAGTQVPAHWLKYRQDLRDIPSQTGFPYNVVWPSVEDSSGPK